MKRTLAALMIAAVAIAGAALPGRQSQAEALPGNTQVQIGLVNTLFRGTSDSFLRVLARPLKTLMETQTGYSGELRSGGDPFELASLLQEQVVHLGVFHGFEYAWVRDRYPTLKPLVVPINQSRVLHACLVVRKDSPITTCADLKGKVLGKSLQAREHCNLFLERRCCQDDTPPRQFYAEVATASSGQSALDDLIDQYADAAVVEKEDLEAYQKGKPGRAGKLRVLLQSEPFPPGVLVYKKGALSEQMLARFRNGLLSASETQRGKSLLEMCRMRGFEPIPANFDRMLTDICKAYPAPARK